MLNISQYHLNTSPKPLLPMITAKSLFKLAGLPIPQVLESAANLTESAPRLTRREREAIGDRVVALRPNSPPDPKLEQDLFALFRQFPGEEEDLAGTYVVRVKDAAPEEMKRLAIKRGGTNIQHLDNPSEELQLLAVTRDGLALQYIKNPSEQVQRRAVQTTGVALRYVEDQTDEIVALALAEDPGAIGYVKNPTEEMLQNYISRAPHMIHRIKNPSFEVQKLAVQASGRNIVEIPNPSEELQWIAVRQNPDNVRYIKPQATEEVQKYAIQQDDSVYKNIKNPTPGATALQAELWGS